MRKILMLTIMASMFSCKTINQANNNIRNTNTEKFNIKKLKNQELCLNELYTEEGNNSIIQYGVFTDYIVKNVIVKGNPYHTKKTYYKSNNQLRAESNYFYRVPIGVSKQYDEKGHVLQEIKWAQLEKRIFSIEDLIKKMKDDFNIDLLDPEEKGVSIAGVPLAYTVGLYKKDFSDFRLIEIDATTGQLLSDEILTYEK